MQKRTSGAARSSRRTFLKQSSAALAFASALPDSLRSGVFIRTDDTLRVALIGCGGRGAGAGVQALRTAGPIKLVAMADAFRDRLDGAFNEISKEHPDKVDVPEERKFVGFDAYQKATDCGVDVVLLTTPPGFRPQQFEYAVQQGKHVFMEKPVAVDAPGIRKVLAAAEESKKRNLKVGVGLQRHHDPKYQETVRRLQGGAIGNLVLLRAYWNGAGVWVHARKPGMTEMEYQMRNWYYFNWLCGDHIVEQHIHNLDVCNWVKGATPVSAQGQGGRQVRTGVEFGEIYDHHMVEFTYADGSKMLSQCRHISGCWDSVSEHAHGSAGTADLSAGIIVPATGEEWRYRGEDVDPYQVEHDRLFAAIRQDQPHNEAEYGALSTMTSILGRMATYSGRLITWQEAIASELALVPSAYDWNANPPTLPDEHGRYKIAMPGSTAAM